MAHADPRSLPMPLSHSGDPAAVRKAFCVLRSA